MRYSGFRVLQQALTGHKGWQPAWRDPAPKHIRIVIIGGAGRAGHAYYLRATGRQYRGCWKRADAAAMWPQAHHSPLQLHWIGNEPFQEFSAQAEGRAGTGFQL